MLDLFDWTYAPQVDDKGRADYLAPAGPEGWHVLVIDDDPEEPPEIEHRGCFWRSFQTPEGDEYEHACLMQSILDNESASDYFAHPASENARWLADSQLLRPGRYLVDASIETSVSWEGEYDEAVNIFLAAEAASG